MSGIYDYTYEKNFKNIKLEVCRYFLPSGDEIYIHIIQFYYFYNKTKGFDSYSFLFKRYKIFACQIIDIKSFQSDVITSNRTKN